MRGLLILIACLVIATCPIAVQADSQDWTYCDKCDSGCPHDPTSDWGYDWDHAWCTINEAIAHCALDGHHQVWVVDWGHTYGESVKLKTDIAIFGGFTGKHQEREQVLSARHPDIHKPTIDPGYTGPCVDYADGAGVFAFRLFHGSGKQDDEAGGTCGGGIYGSGNVEDCIIKDCVCTKYGAGIYSKGGGIADTIIENCSASNPSSHDAAGGGVYAKGDTDLSWCRVNNNYADQYGGGICYWTSNGTIDRTWIEGNKAGDANAIPPVQGDGGGIYMRSGSLTLKGCVVAGNKASHDGGGIYLYDTCTSTMTNNTIADNLAGHDGGGLYMLMNCSVELYNNIFYHDHAPNGHGCLIYGNSTNSVSSWHNDFYTVDDTHCCMFGPHGLDMFDQPTWHENTNCDPHFTYDYHLAEDSCCIDKGDNGAPCMPDTDLDHDDRILDGPDPDGEAVVDIGADEFAWAGAGSAKKDVADGDPAGIPMGYVTAVFGDCIYVEMADRSSGIKVVCSAGHGPTEWTVGDAVRVSGEMATDDGADNDGVGERYIMCSTGFPEKLWRTKTLMPLAFNNRDLGGGDFGKQKGVVPRDNPEYNAPTYDLKNPSVGRNNIGLLVRSWGKVMSTQTSQTENYIYIDDGSQIKHSSSRTGVKVELPLTTSTPSVGQYVLVTGIMSCTKDTTDKKLRRLVRVRKDADLTTYSVGL